MNRKRVFFDNLACKWDDSVNRSKEKEERLNSLTDRFGIKKGDSVLDIGCGTGRMLKKLNSLIDGEGFLAGCDFSLEMLKRACLNGVNHKNNLVCCDAHFLPFTDDCFDKVILFSCFPHFDDKKRIIQEISRVLKSRGIFFICHLTGSEQLAAIHKKADISVENDILPDKPGMRDFISGFSIEIRDFVDKDNLYFLSACKN